MGRIKPEDRTTLAASAFAVIAGLVTAGGGIATLLAADDANERQEHSGDIARIGGITAITGGFTAAIGGLVSLGLKLAEIAQRDDADDEADDAEAPAVTQEQLQGLITSINQLRTTLEAEHDEVQQMVPQLVAQQDEHVGEQV
jgi:hypothetical protein